MIRSGRWSGMWMGGPAATKKTHFEGERSLVRAKFEMETIAAVLLKTVKLIGQ